MCLEDKTEQVAQLESKKKGLSFDGLPFEVREKVFKEDDVILSLTIAVSILALIIALRPTKHAYYQPLRLFYKKSILRLHEKNNWDLASMPDSILASIERLEIIVS